jgi:CheY-like chemotaxis protein
MGQGDNRRALIVVHNDLTRLRLSNILERRGYEVDILNDGDAAVDRFIRTMPELAFLSLDIPTLDGHITALEIRETDPHARLVFVASKTRLSLAEDAAHSAGAVAVIQSPIIAADIDESWGAIMGPIPNAPGLADLDELYPDLRSVDGEDVVQVVALDGPSLSAIPSVGDATPPSHQPIPVQTAPPINPVEKPPKKKRGLLILTLVLITGAIGLIGFALKESGMF